MPHISCPKCKGFIDQRHFDIGEPKGQVCYWCWEKWMIANGRKDSMPDKEEYKPDDDLTARIRRLEERHRQRNGK